jgi:hypothetical protein
MDGFIVVRRDDRTVVEEKIREQLVQADIGLKASPARPHPPRDPAPSVSGKAIIAITAAVIVMAFGLWALLPSMLTRPGVDPTPADTLPAPIPTQVEPFADLQPVPVPEPLPAPAAPAPVSNDSASVANTAPVLDERGRIPSAPQAGSRVGGADVLVPGAAKGTAASRTTLTAAEQAAVARGLKELERMAALKAQRRSAPNRFALTEAEKASVERGLRELEKAAKQQSRQR